MSIEPKCPRCGAVLKIVEVKVLKPLGDHCTPQTDCAPRNERFWETRQEVADCPRCTGSY